MGPQWALDSIQWAGNYKARVMPLDGKSCIDKLYLFELDKR